MKILAVIPARAGSKGIPNKNIRIVAGHPLVYYAIRNALGSQYISDVVVSTDSPEVQIIARQMGVGVKERDASLCADDVTLDAVIFDAIPQEIKWDYIVTLQPTSPTLRVGTLDRAIEETVRSGVDTMISAINAPHLTWGVRDGKLTPNYARRLNRQYLPPCYLETGAFLIAKAGAVTAESRIGERVSVFEVPESESFDVDTFEDLQSVSSALKRESVAIYVNGNNRRGIGHIYRALELADEFYVKPDIYYDINQTDVKLFGTTTHNLIPVNGIAELYEFCRKKQYTVFINDILTTTIDYMIGLRSVLPKAKIVNFEDEGEGAEAADVVINALLGSSTLSKVYSGERYYIAGKTFMFYRPIEIRDHVNRVFICFGGSDPQNYTDRLMRIITKDDYRSYQFRIALGRGKENVDELLEYNRYPNIGVFYDVHNMPELMSSCDVAVTSRGRTAYELAILGIPTIAMSQNEREQRHNFACNENGFHYIGQDPTDEIIESSLKMLLHMSREGRMHYQKLLLSHDLRGGRERVMALINS